MTKEIMLSKGLVALVDDDDYERINKYNWFANYMKSTDSYRAIRNVSIFRGGGMIYMHREIMKTPKGSEVDHINHNTLDNRKCNLRNVTKAQNNMNKRPQKKNACGFLGVHRVNARYRAVISISGITTHLGYFSAPEEAARAYDKKARELFGEYAYLNFPEELQ